MHQSIEQKIIQKSKQLIEKYGRSFGIVAKVMISTFMPKSSILGEFVWRVCDAITQKDDQIKEEDFLKDSNAYNNKCDQSTKLPIKS